MKQYGKTTFQILEAVRFTQERHAETGRVSKALILGPKIEIEIRCRKSRARKKK